MGRGFSYYLFGQGLFQTPADKMSSSNERLTPFFMFLNNENNDFLAQAGKPKTVLE